MEEVSFIRMDQGTREEYQFLAPLYFAERDRVADTALGLLRNMAGPKLGYKIDRYQHSLQSATRAMRDGAEEEMVVAALLHDVGDALAPDNHSQVAAAIIRPFVSERTYWVILHHGIFQGYYYFHHLDRDRDAREAFRGHPHFEACAEFCARWDQTSFDPDYETAPLETFEPMVRRLMTKPLDGFD